MQSRLALAFLLPLMIATTAAQAPVTWIRSFPEQTMRGCTWYIASWSDGSFSGVPWQCGSTSVVAKPDGTRLVDGFPQQAANGCVEIVSRWDDGSFSWIPFTCPTGITYPKSLSNGVVSYTLAPSLAGPPPRDTLDNPTPDKIG